MIFLNKMSYTFDDVLLVPQYTEIISRKDVSLKTRLTRNINIDIPIISANMDTVTEHEMIKALKSQGGRGIFHRFMNMRKMCKEIDCCNFPVSISVGVVGEWKEYINTILEMNYDTVDSVCIDIAHGDCNRVIEVLRYIKKHYPNIDVICGNVATISATKRICDSGADAIKIGIGPGSLCTTRIVTGCGVSQLTAIMDCAIIANTYNIPIIADGGIRNSGDIVKALAAGASSVMVGSLFAGTDETPGNVERDIHGNRYKKYRGMASKDAMIDWKGDSCKNTTPEGEITFVPYKGSVVDIIKDLCGGIRSGMTYNNAQTISQLQKNAVFRVVSSNTARENGAHGLK